MHEILFIRKPLRIFIDCEEADEPDALLNKIMETQDALLRSFSRKFADPSLDLDHMVPRTGNWDMKRSLNRKLERLERRTHRAIIKAVQQKQQEEKKFQSTEVTLIPSSSDEE